MTTTDQHPDELETLRATLEQLDEEALFALHVVADAIAHDPAVAEDVRALLARPRPATHEEWRRQLWDTITGVEA